MPPDLSHARVDVDVAEEKNEATTLTAGLETKRENCAFEDWTDRDGQTEELVPFELRRNQQEASVSEVCEAQVFGSASPADDGTGETGNAAIAGQHRVEVFDFGVADTSGGQETGAREQTAGSTNPDRKRWCCTSGSAVEGQHLDIAEQQETTGLVDTQCRRGSTSPTRPDTHPPGEGWYDIFRVKRGPEITESPPRRRRRAPAAVDSNSSGHLWVHGPAPTSPGEVGQPCDGEAGPTPRARCHHPHGVGRFS